MSLIQVPKLFKKGAISKNIWVLTIYYVLSYLVIISGHYIAIKYFPEVWNLRDVSWDMTPFEVILLILISIITSLFILVYIPKCQRKNSKNYIYIVPIFIFATSISSLFLIPQALFLIPQGLNFGMLGFMGALSFFSLIFLLILFYDETPTNAKALDLMHRRYLQYFSSFVWLVIIGGTWVIWFLLQQMPPKKTDMFSVAFTIATFQNLFVGGVGLLLAAYSFNKRLRDIEQKIGTYPQKNINQ